MTRLGPNSWGKSSVRVSKIHRNPDGDDFSDLTVQVELQGEVEGAYLQGDNSRVLPTDTMRNIVYCLAQEHLEGDLEGFGRVLARHFLKKEGVEVARIELEARLWQRTGPHGFVGGSSERRTARVEMTGDGEAVEAGIDGLVVLKTTGSAFSGFPKDQYTILGETDDRILATSISARWPYEPLPADTTTKWRQVRDILVERFFDDWSASVQHQGWLMGQAVLDSVPEITEIRFRLPNQHHIGFQLERFGLEDRGVVFQPVTEPYGDIRFVVTR